MKKILALLCGLAFASGAWASYTYTFNIGINGLPADYHFTASTGLYLIDKTDATEGSVGTVLFYTLSNEYQLEDGKWIQRPTSQTHSDPTLVLNGRKYGNMVATVSSGELGAGQSSDGSLKFTGTVNGEGDVPFANPYVPNSTGLTKDDLQLVVWDSQTGFYQMVENTSEFPIRINFALSDDGRGNLSWGVTSSLYVTVPEPTSGLLMLLGVAGLALRRKRVS